MSTFRMFRGLSSALLASSAAIAVGFATPAGSAPVPVVDQTASISQIEVDVELVLAVDVSFSMDLEEQNVQRAGYLAALRSPEFIDAVRNGALGKVAITYVEWGGEEYQDVVVPWGVIENEADAKAFADALEGKPLQKLPRTSISAAIEFSAFLIRSNPYKGLRQVIDVSGDGMNNAGKPVTQARDWAAERGIVINGLPLLMQRETSGTDHERLDAYYQQCVITGPGAFVIPVKSTGEFNTAIRTKIIREIAAVQPVQPTLEFASSKEQEIDCSAGDVVLKMTRP
jgi:hypothetical protein